MKIMKSYRRLIPIVAIPIFLISAVILYFPQAAVQFFKIHWLALAAVCVLGVSSCGKVKLASLDLATPKYPFWRWLSRIMGLQICLYAVFLGVNVVCAQTASPPQPILIHQTFSNLLIYQGLFPWGFFLLIALGMGFYSYALKKDAYLASTVSTLIQNPIVHIVINYISRLATAAAYSVALFLMSLLGASAFGMQPLITGFTLTPIIVTIILVAIVYMKRYRRHLPKLLGQELPLIPGLFVWVVFLGALIWMLNGIFAPWTHIDMAPPSLLKPWLEQPWRFMWVIFANSWWMLWAPLVGITLARFSRGYSIRMIIAGVLVLPLIMSIVLGVVHSTSWTVPPIAAALISAAGLFGMFCFTLNKSALPSVVLVNLPREDHYKFRSYQRLLLKITQSSVLFLFVYLPSGLVLVNWLFFSITWTLIILTFLSVYIIFRWLCQQHRAAYQP